MKNKDYTHLRIVYMGTPEFAVAPLAHLLENGCQVVGVVTSPDRPAGRGYHLQPSPVKKYAEQHQILVLQPEKLRDEAFLATLQALAADVFVVVAFRMLPALVFEMPPLGTFNLHASLLPKYRGAAPINWAVINGETETGLTTFFIEKEIDTGKIILQESVPIGKDTTAGELHDTLMQKGADLVLQTVKAIATGNVQVRVQDLQGDYPKAPKIFREDCRIDFFREAEQVYNFIRGLSPYPGAFTEFQDKALKIFKAKYTLESHRILPGKWVTDYKTHLSFACEDGFIHCQEVQAENKKRMSVVDFLNGISPD
ncbi:MAG: methionyl-tRNA formyltransferase [Chitinophagales bacterium]|nr:methionyl-tRNA formyltransferase [Bacteroidota bacterium]MCB9043778.1 methionyl-tRNA formyltransferase [Chitinophagales bacterium]